MRIRRLKAVGLSALIIMSTIAGLHSGLSLLMEAVTIHSSGSIGSVPPTILNYTVAYTSEIRALFVHSASFGTGNVDWNLIAQTASSYNINVLIVEMLSNTVAFYPSEYLSSTIDLLTPAIIAAHSNGLELHVLMDTQLGAPEGSQYRVELSDGTLFNWLSPVKSASRILIKNIVEELVTNYDIDGFMFDFNRYDTVDSVGPMSYSQESKVKFEEYLGETITDWSDFIEGGSRYNEFMEWRIIPITELVRDMRAWMLAIKPDLEFSAAVWAWWPGTPTFNRWRIGQDWTDWAMKGYLDWAAPMIYMTDIDLIGQIIQDIQQKLGEVEAKIPLVPFLTNTFPSAVDPANFKAQVDKVRELGADGWAIWRYGGPGDYSDAPDIRNYLDLISLPQPFSMKDVNISPDITTIITWTTDLPASSKVEYSTSPLFTASFKLLPATTTPDGISIPTFNYWDIDHVPGTIVEDATLVTNHSVTLTGLQGGTKYYFRVQSEDQTGIATTKVYDFTASA